MPSAPIGREVRVAGSRLASAHDRFRSSYEKRLRPRWTRGREPMRERYASDVGSGSRAKSTTSRRAVAANSKAAASAVRSMAVCRTRSYSSLCTKSHARASHQRCGLSGCRTRSRSAPSLPLRPRRPPVSRSPRVLQRGSADSFQSPAGPVRLNLGRGTRTPVKNLRRTMFRRFKSGDQTGKYCDMTSDRRAPSKSQATKLIASVVARESRSSGPRHLRGGGSGHGYNMRHGVHRRPVRRPLSAHISRSLAARERNRL